MRSAKCSSGEFQAGLTGAEYQVQIRQAGDLTIADGVAQCGSIDRLVVGLTGSDVSLANVSIGQNLSSVSLSGRCGLLLSSLNQSITASNRLHNGNGIGLKCGVGGASGATACAATNITYGLMTTSYMCHQACDVGR